MKDATYPQEIACCEGPTPGAAAGPMSGLYALAKLAFDTTAAALLLVLSSPLIAIAAVVVKLTSRGQAFYSQTRVGRDGQPYRIYKIRTMYRDAESDGRARWCRPGDPRVTPIGRFLRETHLDELPQLWNVLRGEMSLVGPRPERPEIVAQLEKAFPDYHRRHRVRPGMTGLAQVNIPPDTDLESVRRKLAYDSYYIDHHNAWMDLRILVSTATSLLGVPFASSRRLLRLPSSELVEGRESLGTTELEAVSEVQPA